MSDEYSCSSGTTLLGTVIAILLSYKLYGWTFWMILHGLFGSWYVAYWIIFQSPIERFIR